MAFAAELDAQLDAGNARRECEDEEARRKSLLDEKVDEEDRADKLRVVVVEDDVDGVVEAGDKEAVAAVGRGTELFETLETE